MISHYSIVTKLGEGGMGRIYLAKDTELNRKAVLKFLPAQCTSNEFLKTRFKREAQAAAALKHPNIITVFELGEYRRNFYIAMEYVEGHSLGDWIQQRDIRILNILNVVIQVCRGLRKAHDVGIVHRDIKPANIMVDRDGWVKILDFGLAKMSHMTQITKQGVRVGTLPYMSPEQINGRVVDRRSDIYSLGIVLYQLITHQLPFKGTNEDEIFHRIRHEKAEPLARYKSGVTDGLQRIIDKALEKEPEMRFQHIDEFLSDLKREKRIYKNAVQPTVTVQNGASVKKHGQNREPAPKPMRASKSRTSFRKAMTVVLMVFVMGGFVANSWFPVTIQRVYSFVRGNLARVANTIGAEQGLGGVSKSILPNRDQAPRNRGQNSQDTNQNPFPQNGVKPASHRSDAPATVDSPLITDLARVPKTADLLKLLGTYRHFGVVTVGNREDMREANGCYVFVVDPMTVHGVFRTDERLFQNVNTNESLASLSGEFAGKRCIWVRDNSTVIPSVDDILDQHNKPLQMHASLWQRENLSDAAIAGLGDFKVLD